MLLLLYTFVPVLGLWVAPGPRLLFLFGLFLLDVSLSLCTIIVYIANVSGSCSYASDLLGRHSFDQLYARCFAVRLLLARWLDVRCSTFNVLTSIGRWKYELLTT